MEKGKDGCSSSKDLAADKNIKTVGKAPVVTAAQRDIKPAEVHGSGDPSTRPKIYTREDKFKPDSSGTATDQKDGGEEEVPVKCTREDVEHTFKNLYCYSNVLQSMAEDNDTDHFRFAKFIQQVEHKQSEVIRVSEALPECANLAIDLAYNCVVTASYMSLMFSSDSGMQVLVEEITRLAMITAHELLQFAHSSQAKLIPGCVEDMMSVMQKFCLRTLLSQVNQLPNLTTYQRKVMAKVKDIIEQMENDSEASLSTFDLSLSSDDSAVGEAIKEAENFGRDAYKCATQISQGSLNTNNNADDSSNSGDEQADAKSDCEDVEKAITEKVDSTGSKAADMDDVILFSKCNPYADIWKLYTDNTDLISPFKINNKLRQECLDALPDYFKIIRWLEEMAHDIIGCIVAEEFEMVNYTFHTLQSIISNKSVDENNNSLLCEIVNSFEDMESRYDFLIQRCHTDISKALDELKSESADSCSSASGSESSDDGEVGVAVAHPVKE